MDEQRRIIWLHPYLFLTLSHTYHLQGKTLGRLSTLVANHLRGANLPTYTPSVDMGGYVVVINSEKVTVTGNKSNDKLYRRHTTGRPGKMKVSLSTFNLLPLAKQ